MVVKEMRNQTGLSQSKFGRKFNIPVTNIQHWEQGVSTPPEYVIYMMHTILEQEKRIKELENG